LIVGRLPSRHFRFYRLDFHDGARERFAVGSDDGSRDDVGSGADLRARRGCGSEQQCEQDDV
jgi:hypothetical protein